VSGLSGRILKKIEKSGVAVRYYALTDSTNARAREYARDLATGESALFLADAQTAGRGRLGRDFYSPASTGLYMTLLTEAPEDARFELMTALTAVVCRRAIERVLGVGVEIKWVNDLYLGGKKVAGILAESFECGGRRLVAVGIGINISTNEFPDNIRATADSLKPGGRISGTRRARLASAVTRGLLEAFSAENVSEYMREYRAYSCVIGREVEYTCGNEVGRGIAEDITETGALTVSTESGTVTLRGGEISLRVR